MKARALSRQHDLQTLPRSIGDHPWTVDIGRDRKRHFLADRPEGRAFAFHVQLEELKIAPAAIVDQHLDRRGLGRGSEAPFLRTGEDSTGLVVAIRPEDDVVGLVVRPQQDAEFRDAIDELHAIDVVATRADAAEEDRFHRAERLEHGLQLGRLAPDLGRQRRAHPLVIGRSALQIIDPSQNRLLAARQRDLIPESIRCRRDPTRKVFLDRLRPGRADPWRQSGAIHRLVQ